MADLVKIDTSAFERAASRLSATPKQMAFGISKALNQSAFATREVLINQTWPQHVTMRNKSFIKWALGVETSTKTDLSIAITDKRANGRGNISLHADGGNKSVERGAVAVPVAGQRIGSRGVVASQRPRNVKGAFRKGDAVYAPVGKGKRRHLKLLYVLKASVKIPKAVPMHEDFKRVMTEQMQMRTQAAMLDAIKGAIRK
ncbi:hypothetical protein FBZ99_101276 [Rhizobium sp. ERR 1071]|nr:hypothetical protein FBZ99_101276 [Rhizobium sp. ERR1071]